MMDMFGIETPLGMFELLDISKDASSSEDPYNWRAPHWLPNPMPSGYDIAGKPWLRPEQASMSFVGASLASR